MSQALKEPVPTARTRGRQLKESVPKARVRRRQPMQAKVARLSAKEKPGRVVPSGGLRGWRFHQGTRFISIPTGGL